MSVIAISTGSSSAYLQELQFEAAQATEAEAEVLQAGTIQAAYVLAATTNADSTRAGYLHEANVQAQIGADHAAGLEAAKAQAADVLATATASEEILSVGNTHHHYHHGGLGPVDEMAALTQPVKLAPAGMGGLDTTA